MKLISQATMGFVFFYWILFLNTSDSISINMHILTKLSRKFTSMFQSYNICVKSYLWIISQICLWYTVVLLYHHLHQQKHYLISFSEHSAWYFEIISIIWPKSSTIFWRIEFTSLNMVSLSKNLFKLYWFNLSPYFSLI